MSHCRAPRYPGSARATAVTAPSHCRHEAESDAHWSRLALVLCCLTRYPLRPCVLLPVARGTPLLLVSARTLLLHDGYARRQSASAYAATYKVCPATLVAEFFLFSCLFFKFFTNTSLAVSFQKIDLDLGTMIIGVVLTRLGANYSDV